MLIIYTSLEIGGIQTFLVRLAKTRFYSGLSTKILVLCPHYEGQRELTSEIKKYAKVFFTNDIFMWFSRSMSTAGLIAPIKHNALSKMLEDVNQIHVTSGYHALIAKRFNVKTNNNIAITVGFYHSMEFCWGAKKIPYHERINRQFIFHCIPKPNLLTFSETVRKFYEDRGLDVIGASIFRIGAIESNMNQETKTYKGERNLKIVSVGRLVDFKTYNLWMLDVIHELLKKNIHLRYDIYGEGPLKETILEKIENLGLSNYVFLKGNLDYSKLNNTLIEYDLFVGSGTTIIQAASLGLCGIVGIESSKTDLTYGFFSSAYKFDYNISETENPKKSTRILIEDFNKMSIDAKQRLSEQHIIASEEFNMANCAAHFEGLGGTESQLRPLNFSSILYTIDCWIFNLLARLNMNSEFSKKYVNQNQSRH